MGKVVLVVFPLLTLFGNEDAMTPDDIVHQSGGEQPREESTPTVHQSTIPNASSSPPSTEKQGDAVDRPTPMEYSDWLDEDFDFGVVPACQVDVLNASFHTMGQATPTPYDFDE